MTDPSVHPKPDLPPTWRDDLFALLDRQQTVCRELHRCSERQSDLIRAESAPALLELLNHRQALIDELAEIGRDLEPYRNSWPELWPLLDPTDQIRFTQAVSRVEECIGLISSHDRQAQQRIEEVKSGIQSELRTMNAGRAGARAYTQSTTGLSDRWSRRLKGGEDVQA